MKFFFSFSFFLNGLFNGNGDGDGDGDGNGRINILLFYDERK